MDIYIFMYLSAHFISVTSTDLLKNQQENVMDEILSANQNLGKEKFLEGDIIRTSAMTYRNVNNEEIAQDAQTYGKWPDGIIAYAFRDSANNYMRSAVMAAIAEFSEKTCVKLIPRTTEPDYVLFIKGEGCYAYIGKLGGPQEVSLGSNCNTKGIAIHEIMHTIGFWHEQSRLDRDTYITIQWANIQRDMQYNFAKYHHSQAVTLDEPYDKQSIMHYSNFAYSINGLPTIISTSNPYERLGQRYGLSDIDVRQVNKYYNCPSTTPSTTEATTTTATTAKPVCKDNFIFCEYLSHLWCGHAWVNQQCRYSCKACPEHCKDLHPACPVWATQYSYCTDQRPTFRGYMKTFCRKSCMICPRRESKSRRELIIANTGSRKSFRLK